MFLSTFWVQNEREKDIKTMKRGILKTNKKYQKISISKWKIKIKIELLIMNKG